MLNYEKIMFTLIFINLRHKNNQKTFIVILLILATLGAVILLYKKVWLKT